MTNSRRSMIYLFASLQASGLRTCWRDGCTIGCPDIACGGRAKVLPRLMRAVKEDDAANT